MTGQPQPSDGGGSNAGAITDSALDSGDGGIGSGYGCYGLRFAELPDARRHLQPAAADAPTLSIVRTLAPADSSPLFEVTDEIANVPLSDAGSRLNLDRATGTARLSLYQEYADEALLHPLLSGSCAILNWWHGRDAFHAGAFELKGRAWVVIGDKGLGKSTTLGYLAAHGVPIISDDLVVIDNGHVLAGPAFVDLRADAARRLGVGRDMGVLGARERFRLDVPTPPARLPLAGWLVLAWDDAANEASLQPVPLPQRLPLLFHNRGVRLAAASPATFVGHAAKPFFRLSRPKRWTALDRLRSVLDSLPA